MGAQIVTLPDGPAVQKAMAVDGLVGDIIAYLERVRTGRRPTKSALEEWLPMRLKMQEIVIDHLDKLA